MIASRIIPGTIVSEFPFVELHLHFSEVDVLGETNRSERGAEGGRKEVPYIDEVMNR